MIRLAAFLGGAGTSLSLLDMTPSAGMESGLSLELKGVEYDIYIYKHIYIYDPNWTWTRSVYYCWYPPNPLLNSKSQQGIISI